MNTLMTVLIMMFSSIIAAAGAVFMKLGSKKFIIKFSYKEISDIIKNWRLLSGVFLYGISAVVFIVILKSNKLSFLYPLSSLTYVFITILSAWILKEDINRYKIIGISFVILGVVLVSLR